MLRKADNKIDTNLLWINSFYGLVYKDLKISVFRIFREINESIPIKKTHTTQDIMEWKQAEIKHMDTEEN